MKFLKMSAVVLILLASLMLSGCNNKSIAQPILERDNYNTGGNITFVYDEIAHVATFGGKDEVLQYYEEDIAKEHEKYITEYFDGPVFITDWPKDIKAFYMKLNEDGKTVAAVDLEVPGAGEIMGGSQREEDYDKLVKRMDELQMEKSTLDWYINLRKFGGCVHSGFGMGFERLLIYLTGVENIRDVIPYPRTPGNCEF